MNCTNFERILHAHTEIGQNEFTDKQEHTHKHTWLQLIQKFNASLCIVGVVQGSTENCTI